MAAIREEVTDSFLVGVRILAEDVSPQRGFDIDEVVQVVKWLNRLAWLLDKQDGLAAPLARDGDPKPVAISETDTTLTIEWKGSYRIEGAAFIYTDRKRGGMRAILGYPTQKLEAVARSS